MSNVVTFLRRCDGKKRPGVIVEDTELVLGVPTTVSDSVLETCRDLDGAVYDFEFGGELADEGEQPDSNDDTGFGDAEFDDDTEGA